MMSLLGGDYDRCTLPTSVSVTINGRAAVVNPGTPIEERNCPPMDILCRTRWRCDPPAWSLPAH
ncbi:MAG: hypothetical protein ACYC8T_26440, partial [Myxococcaceae bacterium]